MKPSIRLRQFRENLGLDPLALAEAASISGPEYYDLESTDDIETSININYLKRIAFSLHIRLAAIFVAIVPDKKISPEELRGLLNEKIKSRGIKLSQIEDEIGWELQSFIETPKAILQWNMTCLYDVCRALDCSWIAVLNGIDDSEDF